jgi:hypothetical protein
VERRDKRRAQKTAEWEEQKGRIEVAFEEEEKARQQQLGNIGLGTEQEKFLQTIAVRLRSLSFRPEKGSACRFPSLTCRSSTAHVCGDPLQNAPKEHGQGIDTNQINVQPFGVDPGVVKAAQNANRKLGQFAAGNLPLLS